MTSTAPSNRPAARLHGLDGLRAIAVALVVVYHLFPPALLPGGFIGVDVFFVISGFLITSLLLREHDDRGRIRLGRFWIRRARRLLPALVAVVAVCSTLAWLVGGDVLVRLGAQIAGVATFSYNWLSIAGGGGYFAAATPELFRNFWSLAVEEQFYVLWPLVLPVFLFLPRRWLRVAAAAVLAAVSALWMGTLISRGDDLTRAYFGTDTHAFGLLLGVALAFLLAPLLSRPAAADVPAMVHVPGGIDLAPGWHIVLPPSAPRPEATRPRWVDTPMARHVTGAAGVLAVVWIVALASLRPADDVATFPGALLGASLLTAVAIVAGVWPGSWFGRGIDVAPLRWVGDRSYAIYLWHWPLLVLAVAAAQGTAPIAGVPVWIGLCVLAATVAASALSYRFLEMPVRRLGFRAAARAFFRRMKGSPPARLRAVGAAVAGVLVLAGTGAALAAAPEESSGASVVADGRAALDEAERSAGASPSPTPVPAEPVPSPPPALTTDAAPPPPIHVPGDQITAVGDSVMLASAPGLLERLPGIEVDAEVSRSIWAGPGMLESLAQAGRLRPHVVVALGTNGPVNRESLDRMAAVVGPDRDLVLVNAYAPRDWIPGVNADLQAFADAHPNVGVADWSGAIAPHVDLLAGDQVHPGSAGGRIFADTVAAAVDDLAEDRRDRRAQLLRDIHAYFHVDLD
ncbi:acyltransferase family protein [Microbacterium cremeum]|uniref:acyltransferase family protein n=1 Tax=Microbacterium cremeum TaxID=2782169 RepID=UPI001887B52E|nr:acyltransferase family protein [Microbacterium cremeum]